MSSAGCEATVNKLIVIDSVKALFDVNQNTFCGAGTVSFSEKSLSFYPIKYQWQFGDDSKATDASPSHFYGSPGVYYPKLSITSKLGCKDTLTIQKPVSIFKLPAVSIDSENEKCAEMQVQFKATVAANDSIRNYQWKLGNDVIGSGNNATYLFNNAGKYNVTVAANSTDGCETTVSKNITIHPLPVPVVIPDTAICIGQTIT